MFKQGSACGISPLEAAGSKFRMALSRNFSVIADGKDYVATREHLTFIPMFKGEGLYCLDAEQERSYGAYWDGWITQLSQTATL